MHRCTHMDGNADWPADADQFSARQIAEVAGISPTTIANWARRENDPLPANREADRTVFAWGDLVSFARAHRELPAARKFINRLRERPEAGGVSNQFRADSETLRAIAQYARAAAAAASDAALETAELHLKTVRSLRTTIAALDSALTLALASDTLHD